jgi:hypothetical protein
MWYVKISIFGVAVVNATTYHRTKNAALAFIAANTRNHNPAHTQFFIGMDGEKAEEVPFTRPNPNEWVHGKCMMCGKKTKIHTGFGECEACIFDASQQ